MDKLGEAVVRLGCTHLCDLIHSTEMIEKHPPNMTMLRLECFEFTPDAARPGLDCVSEIDIT
eukprot:4023399-Amphidinium_carterae.3